MSPTTSVTVWVTKARRRGRKGHLVRYQLPNGRICQDGGLFTRRREADDHARDLRNRLNTPDAGVLWQTVCTRFQIEKLATLKASGAGKWNSAMSQLDAFEQPKYLGDVTTDLMSRWGAWLREHQFATETIRSYLSEILRTTIWASRIWTWYKRPFVELPRIYRLKRGKGRPITREEFDRMLAAVPAIVKAEYLESWIHTLEGFWLSGLRLNDVHVLRWRHGPLAVQEIDSNRPTLYVGPGEDKGGREEWLPMWHFPDLVEFLRATPADQRRGHVFRPFLSRGRASYHSLSATISRVGEAARIIVARRHKKDPETGEPVESTKYASAHDLRASWATRWRPLVDRELLRRWMRHRDYRTTDQYYVGTAGESPVLGPRNTPL